MNRSHESFTRPVRSTIHPQDHVSTRSRHREVNPVSINRSIPSFSAKYALCIFSSIVSSISSGSPSHRQSPSSSRPLHCSAGVSTCMNWAQCNVCCTQHSSVSRPKQRTLQLSNAPGRDNNQSNRWLRMHPSMIRHRN